LHKAALLACGILPYEKAEEEQDLQSYLAALGGGIYLSTKVEGVPKGSGLGTSSILAGACAKALLAFVGCSVTENALFDIVLCMEQIMSTGGGWQDQAGGMTDGVKMITSKPGIRQILHLDRIVIPPKAREELNERFAIVYTGQRRLARNLLRDVVGNYIGGRKESVEALSAMKITAEKMRRALEKGDIDELAHLFNEHWKLSLQLDEGASNLCIEQIFMVIEDLIDGKFIAGAGGGGFLQIIMKKGVTKEQVNERLSEMFQGTGTAVWDSQLIF
ncbi:MAG: bifunctional fucokinase/L-fucose-1-P-guanylyltransferase, partial [Lachnospiraceae bacterium]|nr:bifunctional fucokinase/L-fucose-1-P-guanylyltransferase [Lachnospiraceae bacterium]